jgi:hypothetical protein
MPSNIPNILAKVVAYSSNSLGRDSTNSFINSKYKTVILPVVMYGCTTWSLTLREEHRPRDFENRMLRRIPGPKRKEDVTWRKLHKDELHSLKSSRNIVRVIKSRRMRWAGHVARMGEGRGVYRVLVGRPEGKNHWEDLGVGGRITLRWTLGR